MENLPRLSRLLRKTAIALFACGILLWVATGAHRGWTQTSVTEQHRDEITGIDYPVRRAAFIAGVEIPALSTLLAAALFGAAVFIQRKQTP